MTRMDRLRNRLALGAAYLKGDPSPGGYPLDLTLELTNRCDLGCVMCPRNWSGRAVGDMDIGLFRSIIDQAALGSVSGALSYTVDSTIWGVEMNVLAQKVQSDLNEVGMNLTLDGLPSSTALQKYRDGKDQIGVWSWAADYPDTDGFAMTFRNRYGYVGIRYMNLIQRV